MRIATLGALRPLLIAGAHECILDLTGFRSPNIVPVKAFYGDDLKVSGPRQAWRKLQPPCPPNVAHAAAACAVSQAARLL